MQGERKSAAKVGLGKASLELSCCELFLGNAPLSTQRQHPLLILLLLLLLLGPPKRGLGEAEIRHIPRLKSSFSVIFALSSPFEYKPTPRAKPLRPPPHLGVPWGAKGVQRSARGRSATSYLVVGAFPGGGVVVEEGREEGIF